MTSEWQAQSLLLRKPALGLLLIGLIVVLAMLPLMNEAGQVHVDEAFKRALLAFAIARGLNGVISVAQGTEIAIQPAGVGVNFTPGEILDPVNDLVERFSWIMMLASSSLGVQKILLNMSAWQGLLVAVVLSGVLLASCLLVPRLRVARPFVQRLFFIVLLLRFMMPVISISNDWVYRTFLEADYLSASASLTQAQEVIGQINEEVMVESQDVPSTMFERARALYDNVVAQMDIDRRLEEYQQAAADISESTIRLVVVFLMQTVVFPLIFLFVMLGMLRRVVRPRS